MKKRTFRAKLSFNLAEAGEVKLGASGVNIKSLSKEAFNAFKLECGITESFSWLYNDPKYFENATAQSIMPKPEDFIQVPFRLLSATIVGAGSWKATDFTNEKILKGSASKLSGKPIFKEHNPDLDNWVGIVSGTKWSPSFTQKVGGKEVVVPAGIDGVLDIDVKTNPTLARGIMIGSIFSNSVTVVFDYEKSHEDIPDGEFFEKVGTIAADGKMITRKATKIYDYYETSLVFLGADPFSKSIDVEGNLKNIDVNHVHQEFSRRNPSFEAPEDENVDKKAKKYQIGFELSAGVLSLGRTDRTEPEQNLPKNEVEMKKLIATFIALFGANFNLKAGDELTEEQLETHLKALTFSTEVDRDSAKATKENLAKFMAVATGFEGVEATATPEQVLEKLTFIPVADSAKLANIETLTQEAEIGRNTVKAQREEAVRLYKIAAGEKKNEAVINMMLKASTEELEGLLSTYTDGATSKFKATCKGCGKSEFTFQSSFAGDVKDDKKDEKPTVSEVVTMEDIRRGYATSIRNN